MAHATGEWWSDNKKIDAVTSWLVLGNMVLVAATVGVPVGTLRRWKQEAWWTEMVNQIQIESDQELDAKLAKRVDKALDIINDRMENGDFQYDPKTGEFVRKPVSMKDTHKVMTEMIDRRWVMRKEKSQAVSQEAIGDILKNLATEFAEMAKRKVKEPVHGPEPVPQEPESKLP